MTERCENVRRRHVADMIASCSAPLAIAMLPPMTFTQLVKALRQPTTRAGSESGNATIVARYPRAGRWLSLSNEVWSIHEMKFKSNTSEICPEAEGPSSNHPRPPYIGSLRSDPTTDVQVSLRKKLMRVILKGDQIEGRRDRAEGRR